ncbi:ATP-dependent helicase/nuclease subunit B [Pseudobutyrivibrio ruminis]|uniref:ATP-dependent helicase/nuclease subunit B n=1 Tax=Pseudobutyrivibrio ruminis TaxID=46206 RepID=A0A1H7JZT2_9FIRM|nr:PD-(D/E)XK nuclease family protein [Pseudobutyrivibrio ruminis]SEK80113.1 ATP-dependent helicase/nuclease subunit B [Pseudobutyrivibrio ruminis]
MSLSLIIGNSGSGKSTTLYKRIIKEAMANKDKNFLVIVPEQYTMSTQRLLVSMHPNKCIMNIDVLSFNRLAYRVFEELGAGVNAVLDDTGKSLVIRKLINSNINDIKTLRNNITRISYITQVKSLISELTQYNITPDKLKEMIDTPAMSESFKRKASDLLVLYEAFLDFINGKYVTTESILSTLNDMLDSSEIVNGSTVVLDGFTGFTPIQYQLVEHMLAICDEVAVTITADEDTPLLENLADDELFSMSSEFAIRMNKIAKRVGVTINKPTYISRENGWLSGNEILSHLEKNIFRAKPQKYAGKKQPNSNIVLTSLRSQRDELQYVAIEINKLIREGMHYKDIAVVAPNLEEYRYLVSGIWNDYDIPYFVDAKTEILFHPMTEAIDALFDIFDNDFRREDVFRFLRTNLTDLTFEEMDYLENYLISTGIRGKKKYFHPFAIRSNSYSKDEDLLRVNEIREKFIAPFKAFDNQISKKCSVRTIATALYEIICYFDFEGQIKTREKLYEDGNQPVKAKEYSQIYPVIMDIIDKLVGILGDEEMDLEEFHDIFEAGLSAASIGVIPPANDSVILGDIERTRLSNIKVLFCIGASDDAIPKKVENGGILSQLEREQLLAQGFELAPSDRQKSFRQRFYLYLMLTKPNEKLYITMPRVDSAGKAVNPSYLMDLLRNMFEDLSLKEIESFDIEDRLLSKRSSLEYMIELVNKAATFGLEVLTNQEKAVLEELLNWAKEDSSDELEILLNGAFFQHKREDFSDDIMLAVNEALNADETIKGSVSRFELYNECSYKYFLTYIMKLQEREKFELSSIDMGNFYHEAIQRYSDSLKADNKTFKGVTEEEREAYIETAISQTFQSMAKVATLEDSTQRYIVESMKATLRHVVEIITTQVSRGEFEPELFEEKIQSEIINPVSGEVVANLNGKVDRIDMTDGDDRAVRIIDYKSSGHKLDLDECYYGLSMQLPIYMGVVLDKLKDKYPNSTMHPSAMLYYEMANKFLELSSSGENFKEKQLKLSRMEGILSSEPEDLAANDSTVGIEDWQTKESSIVPFGVKKDGELLASANAISRDDMKTVIDYAALSAAKTAEGIINGQFEPSPAKLGTQIDACRYCGFKSVCHFDENEPGYQARNLEKRKSKSDVLELMKEELGDKDSGTN